MGVSGLALLPVIGETIFGVVESIGKAFALYQNGKHIGRMIAPFFKQTSSPSLPDTPLLGLLPNPPPIVEIKSETFLNISNTNSFCPANYVKNIVSSVKNQTSAISLNNTIQNTTSDYFGIPTETISNVKNQTAEAGSQMTHWIVDSISSAGRKLDETIGANIPFWDSVSTTSKIAAGSIFALFLWRLAQGQKNIQNVTIHHHGPHGQNQKVVRQGRSSLSIRHSYEEEPAYRPRTLKKKEASAPDSPMKVMAPAVLGVALGAATYFAGKHGSSANEPKTCPIPNPFSSVCENPHIESPTPFNISEIGSSIRDQMVNSTAFQEMASKTQNMGTIAYEYLSAAAQTVDQKIGENIPLLPTFLWNQIPPIAKIATMSLLGLWVYRLVRGSNVKQKIQIVIPQETGRYNRPYRREIPSKTFQSIRI